MFARRAVRRRGVGVVGATVITAGAYAAGSSAAKSQAHEQAQDQELAQLEAQQAAQARAQAALQTQPLQQYAPPPQPAAPAPSPGLTSNEAMEQLRKLGELKKEGLLTQEEFEAQKQRLLS